MFPYRKGEPVEVEVNKRSKSRITPLTKFSVK